MTDGTVLPIPKVAIGRLLLKEAALRTGLDARVMTPPHSLRAGGGGRMHCNIFDAKFADDHEIQRRGRWVLNCWKICAWSSRRRDNDGAGRMTDSNVELFATIFDEVLVVALALWWGGVLLALSERHLVASLSGVTSRLSGPSAKPPQGISLHCRAITGVPLERASKTREKQTKKKKKITVLCEHIFF